MIPQTLRSACAEKKLIPIVGAGVSMSLKRISGDALFPSWKELLARAAERLERENKPEFANAVSAMLPLGMYEQAADLARKGLTGGLWNNFFTENFGVRRDEIDEESLALPRTIWKIGTQIITLNYDKVLRFTLVVVNPYTKGIKQLMYAFVEKDHESKAAYFDSALEHLTHIRYYYVEALYFYAQFLMASQQRDKFEKIFKKGIGLARKHHYCFQIYKFEQLVADIPSEYDMNNYPLPEKLDFDGYVKFLLKEHQQRLSGH